METATLYYITTTLLDHWLQTTLIASSRTGNHLIRQSPTHL